MKILSTGEKIKRSRIYKGYTLKQICDDKISVSKMSCIENNKVIAEPWVLELISKELDIDLGYLNENVFEQVKENIEILKVNVKNDDNIAIKDEDYKTNVSYNLEVAEKYNYYDLAIELMHMLFNFYLDKKDFENTQAVTSKYYDLYLKTSIEDNKLTYYIDMARHLYIKEDFLQASSYYRNVRKGLYSSEILNYKKLIIVTYNEAACNIKLENYERAFKVGKRLLDLVKHVDTDLRAAQIYHMLAILSIRMKNGDFQKYEQKSYELYKDKASYKAMAIFNYGSTMFDCNMKEKAIEYISHGLSVYPREDKVGLVGFMLNCVEELIKNDVVELAQGISDEVLNYAINLDDIKFIEKSYYYKAIILDRQGSASSAEMYMNLSLDSLLKFGNKKDIYARYLEMGSMYHKLSNVADSIKYFSLALQLEKKM
ncbi:transcriptional regulator [Clostridium estertheticum]|uniref:Transcriptional regulator n=1 Tax=Clostridium estertheticum TaxID=238834 RepID=A0AA47EKV4_9CLOT|nr:helix-turn-helix domain-containing protein [Clostridium estertheticum]MBU3155397.1 transcriptional regulator [Clostridium estertheticum]MBU3199467.1 transcriptional regulator [Clostridium estertheticum]WAG60468.1 transcriptional regulator [Clostridium estertheticum]WAG65455.1 transcriptional regulator [Clostridium estertheticum]